MNEKNWPVDSKGKDGSLSEGTGSMIERMQKDDEKQAFDKAEAELKMRQVELEAMAADIARREEALFAAERRRDQGFADERSAFLSEMRELRAQTEKEIAQRREILLSELEGEIVALRKGRLEDVAKSESVERERLRAEMSSELEAFSDRQKDVRERIEADWRELERQRASISVLQRDVDARTAELDAAEELQKRREEQAKQKLEWRLSKIDEEVDERIGELRLSLEARARAISDENARLREGIVSQTSLLGAFEQLQRQLGGRDPAEVIHEINLKADEIARLREELAARPTEETLERYRAIKSEVALYRGQVESLQAQLSRSEADVAGARDARRRILELEAENASLTHRASIFEGAANEASAELKRLRSSYEKPAEFDERKTQIELPHVWTKRISPATSQVDEIAWLERVGAACDEYGLHFNMRILKAFHTSLKTAEWSPLTVLAGVSGTGKSELPRLYSHFGGLFFEPVSVQPNWDSQESMLGFFNSIDNKFDAQPLVRFLAQSQKPWVEATADGEGYPGLSDGLCLVLLDEMNLAHPELYFAEFLSKLELRRGRKRQDVPWLPVKMGAGMKPYQLPLGRNVLWAGTMNQDETTKSLSDKVIDRSIVINFPRPSHLQRRQKLVALDDANRGEILHYRTWQSWQAWDTRFSDEEVAPFKHFIEETNSALSVSGRALGHRVWQSVEYYMANYPDVRSALAAEDKDALARAMHVAFEDQLVQKVMPKLRGIDTRGKSKTDCLDKIRRLLSAGVGGQPFNLEEDFEMACELGYGQFIWQSANYLKD